MKRIKYYREYGVTVVQEYTADVPEHLLDDNNVSMGTLDQYVCDNSDLDDEEHVQMDEDSLVTSYEVLGEVSDD